MCMVAACAPEAPPVANATNIHVVKCAEPLPEFTLGPNSRPTAEQQKELCSCIWSKLGNWEREAAEKFATGKEAELSYMYKRGFPPRFGGAIKDCGGMNL